MAFCPNCGTPNTDAASKCVNCNNALTPSGGAGGKFKGTIMMGAAGGPAAPKPPEAAPTPQPPAQGDAAKNLAFQKTMMGPAGGMQPAPEPPSAAAAHAPTMEQDVARPAPAPQAAPPAQSFSQPSSYQDEAPQLPQSNATKTMVMVLGASVLIAALIVGAALFMR